jgi:hypothetical protein
VKERPSDFRDSLRELIDSSPAPEDHPSSDRWLAYHRGELPAEEEESLQEHLVRCRDCFDLSAAAAAFAQPEEEQGAGEEMEAAAVWRLLRPQLDPPPANVREISASPRRQPAWKIWFPSTLAASFFAALVVLSAWTLHLQPDNVVALVGLSAWNLHLQSENEKLRAPRPAHIVDFSSGERLLTPAEKTLTTDTAPWTFVFHPDDDLPTYRLTLRDTASGRALWSYELPPDEDLALTIQVPEIHPGRYRLELSGERADIAPVTYLLRVTEPAEETTTRREG